MTYDTYASTRNSSTSARPLPSFPRCLVFLSLRQLVPIKCTLRSKRSKRLCLLCLLILLLQRVRAPARQISASACFDIFQSSSSPSICPLLFPIYLCSHNCCIPYNESGVKFKPKLEPPNSGASPSRGLKPACSYSDLAWPL